MEFYAIKEGYKGNRKIIDIVRREDILAYAQEHGKRLKEEAEEHVKYMEERCFCTPLEWFFTDKEFGWRYIQKHYVRKSKGWFGLYYEFDKTTVDFEQKQNFSVQYRPMTFWRPKPESNVAK